MNKDRTISLMVAILLVLGLASSYVRASDGSVRFVDVNRSSSVGRAIYEMVNLGVIDGVTERKFEPDAPITASAYVSMLCRLRGLAPLPTESAEPGAGYLEAALDAHWYSWDEIPPTDPDRAKRTLARELAANILVSAFFNDVAYDWSIHEEISDFSQVSGRYYTGVLGGLTLDLFNHHPGTPFYPTAPLSRGDACLWASRALARTQPHLPSSTPELPLPTTATPCTTAAPDTGTEGGVSANGWLQVRGTQLCNERGKPIVLSGMSSMGIQWYPQYTSLQSIRNTARRGANVFRIAMYTEEGGYLSDPRRFTALVDDIVHRAVQCDMYVIIDWHILSDGNPMQHLSEAVAFFDEMSARYASTPNVLYEICNEPNGSITWTHDVKPYAERVVAAIRANSPRGIVLIGSPTWSQDVDVAAADPLVGTNLMYTLHFYAGTHGEALRIKVRSALDRGLPIFATEWGTSDANGSGGVYLHAADEWLSFLAQHGLSWCNWSLCDKAETSAALVPGAPADSEWTEADLTQSGKFVFARFYGQAETSPIPSRPHFTPVVAAQAAQQFPSTAGCTTVVRSGRDGSVLGECEIVGTGCTIESLNGETGLIEKSATIVVYGDVLGTGMITLSQLTRMAQAFTGARLLAEPYLQAASLDGRPGVSLSDLVLEAQLFKGGGTLRCELILNET